MSDTNFFSVTLHQDIPTRYFFNYVCARNVHHECGECVLRMHKSRDVKMNQENCFAFSSTEYTEEREEQSVECFNVNFM